MSTSATRRTSRSSHGRREELRIAVTLPAPGGGQGPTRLAARPSPATTKALAPSPLDVDRAVAELSRRGFRVTHRGRLALSVRGTRALFEATFGTRLETVRLSASAAYQDSSVLFPPPGAPWQPDPALAAFIDDAYIQWPHIYYERVHGQKRAPRVARAPERALAAAAGPSDRPPALDYHHLEAPADVARLLNATAVHQKGTTGRGVRVVMIDSGFAHGHPFFDRHGYSSSVVLAPGASSRATDSNGHGTGESANVFAVAPGVTFTGVKLDDDEGGLGASLLEGFQEALRHRPQVISVSLGFDLRDAQDRQLGFLPNSLKALEAEIQAAIAEGIVLVFSAGNGHYSFPGSMPDVISAGGVFVAADGQRQASNYASAFPSRVYSGRSVPDFCGLVGLAPHADYIALPIPPGCAIDRKNATHDRTRPDDGWGVFSGTSAAAPQLAGVCALLLEKDPHLRPADVKAVLAASCRDVTGGRANASSDEAGLGVAAGPGRDRATGSGLVDALAAWQKV